MTTKQVKWTSEHDQIIYPGLSDGRRAKFLPSVAARSYDWQRKEGYLGNVGTGNTTPSLDCVKLTSLRILLRFEEAVT